MGEGEGQVYGGDKERDLKRREGENNETKTSGSK